MQFKLKAQFTPTGDQPQAIEEVSARIKNGVPKQTLLGVTGSGKTFTMANVIERAQKPTLVISHNKMLAAQLYQEFKEFFPENAVHYFVSYYDYYQPEAYIPHSDTYIEKDAKINDFIDCLRHAATQSVLTRPDTIIISSVSCIYGIGDPDEYRAMSVTLHEGEEKKRHDLLRALAALQYERSDREELPGTFAQKGDILIITPPTGTEKTTIEFFGNIIERINNGTLQKITLFPAKHFVTPEEKLNTALHAIESELEERLFMLNQEGKILEAERLKERTRFDIEMMRRTGYCTGIENYSRHISGRAPGEPPSTLLDYFGNDFLVFIDESHITLPQIRGMFEGDRARKRVLVEHGFRLPSALDNRPLTFEEFERRTGPIVYVSATPGAYELREGPTTEQVIRPTGLCDPTIELRPTKHQIKNIAEEIKKRALRGERALAITITKRLAEDIADYLQEHHIRAEYIHAEVKTLERPELLRKLRKGEVDALVGINLLREGLDIPEVSLVAILDADKEGFLRNKTTLIQTMGRAARHPNGHVIMYADTITGSMREAIDTTKKRRALQAAHNKKHGIMPQAIKKEIREWFTRGQRERMEERITEKRSAKELKKELEAEMLEAAAELNFEKAAELRDTIKRLLF